MNEESQESQVWLWESAHPWLSEKVANDDDSVDEVIRYTLDELRYE